MITLGTIILTLAAAQDWQPSWPEAQKKARESNTLAILVFFNAGVKDCKRYEAETLTDNRVATAMKKYVCAKVDPEGTDDENKLWQEHKMPPVPTTLIFEPDGKLLAKVTALKAQYYAEGLENAWPAYYDKIVPARQAMAKDPGGAAALAMLAEAYAQLNNPQESAAQYAKAVAAAEAKGDSTYVLQLAKEQLDGFYNAKWYGHARGCARKLLDIDPSNKTGKCPMAAWVIGMADCEDRKWDDAIIGLKAACEKYKDCDILDKMMFSLGSAYMYAKQKDKAIAIFDEIVAKFPNSDTANIASIQAEKLRK